MITAGQEQCVLLHKKAIKKYRGRRRGKRSLAVEARPRREHSLALSLRVRVEGDSVHRSAHRAVRVGRGTPLTVDPGAEHRRARLRRAVRRSDQGESWPDASVHRRVGLDRGEWVATGDPCARRRGRLDAETARGQSPRARLVLFVEKIVPAFKLR